ncbi:glycosyltransferase family 1 protein [Pseudarthrobacter phenanthrenivorans]|uniref:rhamnosyltransferase WsaF family glycosyltransferase n=1 Tax=Pseudarthrobacter phenanthrenivorans TaxID=361575 RepID=UPI0015E866AD|nr:glycosyltransferase family 1 protein [Pseudarthrobacter phenanthrenivorans]
MNKALPLRQMVFRLRNYGLADVSQRIARKTATKISATFSTSDLDFPLLLRDVADSTDLKLAPAPLRADSQPLRIAWLCTPPGAGSGGHTTFFRMIEGMERRGHHCTVLLYDRHGGELAREVAVIRQHWPQLRAEVLHTPSAIEGFDASVASSWETAHVLAARGARAQHRFYFVQDFEPFFYPRGGMYALAEDTYRFGFRLVTVGRMVADLLRREIGIESAVAPFGCDTQNYRLENTGHRHGVAFYTRPEVDRRGFLLAKLALTQFHARHPEQEITTYGDRITDWDVPHRHAGKLSPPQLNRLYNRSLAGIAMSFTNVSLVAEEMLAAGAVPVINDSPLVRKDLDSPYASWARATPAGIAEALCRAVEEPATPQLLQTRSASVRQGWGPAQAAVAAEIEDAVYGPAMAFPGKEGQVFNHGK